MSIGKANTSEDKFSEDYTGIIHEQGTEVFDHDLNLLQNFNKKNFEWLMQTFLGDGYIFDELTAFKIYQADSVVANNFKINSGSYYLKGKRFKLNADVDYVDQSYGYEDITVTAVSGTTLTFEHKKFVPSASSGRDLVGFTLRLTTGAGAGDYVVTSNTETIVTCSASNFTTLGVVAGDLVTLIPPALTASGSGTRTDVVYLDCFEEEVNDYEDTSMRNTAFGFSSSHRLRNGCCVRVAENGSLPSDYVNGDNIHRYIQIATLTRLVSDDEIRTADITDERSMCELAQNVALPSALWEDEPSDITVEFNKKYNSTGTSRVVFTVPTITEYDVKKEIEICGVGTGGWKLALSTGQTLYHGIKTSTEGTGYIQSTNQRDCVRLQVISLTELQVVSCQGNIFII